jgi:hypothetical protein
MGLGEVWLRGVMASPDGGVHDPEAATPMIRLNGKDVPNLGHTALHGKCLKIRRNCLQMRTEKLLSLACAAKI